MELRSSELDVLRRVVGDEAGIAPCALVALLEFRRYGLGPELHPQERIRGDVPARVRRDARHGQGDAHASFTRIRALPADLGEVRHPGFLFEELSAGSMDVLVGELIQALVPELRLGLRPVPGGPVGLKEREELDDCRSHGRGS